MLKTTVIMKITKRMKITKIIGAGLATTYLGAILLTSFIGFFSSINLIQVTKIIRSGLSTTGLLAIFLAYFIAFFSIVGNGLCLNLKSPLKSYAFASLPLQSISKIIYFSCFYSVTTGYLNVTTLSNIDYLKHMSSAISKVVTIKIKAATDFDLLGYIKILL